MSDRDRKDYADKPVSPGSTTDPRAKRPEEAQNPPAREVYPGGAGNPKPAAPASPQTDQGA